MCKCVNTQFQLFKVKVEGNDQLMSDTTALYKEHQRVHVTSTCTLHDNKGPVSNTTSVLFISRLARYCVSTLTYMGNPLTMNNWVISSEAMSTDSDQYRHDIKRVHQC